MEPRRHRRGDRIKPCMAPAAISLQWSHDVTVVEMRLDILGVRHAALASMEPRRHRRGDDTNPGLALQPG